MINSLFRRFIKILDLICSFFFPELQVISIISFQSSTQIIARLHLVLSTSLSFYHPFVYRSYSWRLYMVLHQGFLSFFNCSSRFFSESRSVKLYSKINMVLNTCLFWEVQAFFILHSVVQFFLSYLLRWCYVILDNFLHVSWFTSCQEWDN